MKLFLYTASAQKSQLKIIIYLNSIYNEKKTLNNEK